MLRGKLVNLRPVEREDLKTLQELERNVDLVVLANGHWQPESVARWEKHFDKGLEHEEVTWFVIEVDSKPIGSIGLHHRERRDSTAAVGISILDPDYIGKGYGRDAMMLLLDWAFRIENYRRIWLDTMGTNERAIRSYRACGFVEEGRMRQHYYYNGAYVDAVQMGMLRTEWEVMRAAERKDE